MSINERRKFFKYNEDDILEILTEYLADKNGFDTFGSSAKILGKAGKDLRVIAVVGDFDDDDIVNIDLDQIDASMKYNGTH